MIAVEAIQKGFYGGIIRDPENEKTRYFSIKSQSEFSEKWMKKVKPEKSVKTEEKQGA